MTPTGTTQSEVACSISASLIGPDGHAFQLLAPMRALREGKEVPRLIASEEARLLEVHSWGATGSTIHALTFRSPCSGLTLEFGTAQCRVSAGDGFELRECTEQVFFAPMQLTDG